MGMAGLKLRPNLSPVEWHVVIINFQGSNIAGCAVHNVRGRSTANEPFPGICLIHNYFHHPGMEWLVGWLITWTKDELVRMESVFLLCTTTTMFLTRTDLQFGQPWINSEDAHGLTLKAAAAAATAKKNDQGRKETGSKYERKIEAKHAKRLRWQTLLAWWRHSSFRWMDGWRRRREDQHKMRF